MNRMFAYRNSAEISKELLTFTCNHMFHKFLVCLKSSKNCTIHSKLSLILTVQSDATKAYKRRLFVLRPGGRLCTASMVSKMVSAARNRDGGKARESRLHAGLSSSLLKVAYP
jgi:hypothetical protein